MNYSSQRNPLQHIAKRKDLTDSSTAQIIRSWILVVEDEEPLALFLEDELQRAGYSVLRASDGREAVAVFRDRKEDIRLVMSDVGLPKISGIEAAQQIRQINPSVQIILASGFLHPSQKDEIDRISVGAFVPKPYEISTVLQAIDSLLNPPNTSVSSGL